MYVHHLLPILAHGLGFRESDLPHIFSSWTMGFEKQIQWVQGLLPFKLTFIKDDVCVECLIGIRETI
jgi:hypothetical protein